MTESEIREILDKRIFSTASIGEVRGKDKAAYDIFKKVCERDAEIAQLDAKVYAYEAIISNSNFKMAVVRNKKEKSDDRS